MLDEQARADGLSSLFAAYREACPDPEPGQDFMPQLWRKIEARRSFAYSLKRLAQGIVAAAAVASLVMGVYLVKPQPRTPPSYLELLAAGQSRYTLADTEIVQPFQENAR
jgi:hypothetical protein